MQPQVRVAYTNSNILILPVSLNGTNTDISTNTWNVNISSVQRTNLIFLLNNMYQLIPALSPHPRIPSPPPPDHHEQPPDHHRRRRPKWPIQPSEPRKIPERGSNASNPRPQKLKPKTHPPRHLTSSARPGTWRPLRDPRQPVFLDRRTRRFAYLFVIVVVVIGEVEALVVDGREDDIVGEVGVFCGGNWAWFELGEGIWEGSMVGLQWRVEMMMTGVAWVTKSFTFWLLLFLFFFHFVIRTEIFDNQRTESSLDFSVPKERKNRLLWIWYKQLSGEGWVCHVWPRSIFCCVGYLAVLEIMGAEVVSPSSLTGSWASWKLDNNPKRSGSQEPDPPQRRKNRVKGIWEKLR